VFDPIRIYDKPAVILTQLGNGIATTDSVRRTLFDPAALSPRERDTYTSELKKASGDNPIVNTALDVLGNPLTWLAFIAGGAMASKHFAKSGRFFLGGIEAGGYGQWARGKWPFLRSIRALSAAQELHGTPLNALMESIPGEMKAYHNEFGKEVSAGVRKVLNILSEKHGTKITSLDPEMAPSAAAEEDLKIIRMALNGRLAGFDRSVDYKEVAGVVPLRHEVLTRWKDSAGKEHKEWISVGKEQFDKFEKAHAEDMNNIKMTIDENGELGWSGDFMTRSTVESQSMEAQRDGTFRSFQLVDPTTRVRGDSALHSGIDIEIASHTRGEMIGDIAQLNRDIREFGLEDLIKGADKMRTKIKVKVYGNEEHYNRTGEFIKDDNKILRISRGVINDAEKQGLIGKDGRLNYDEANVVNEILGENIAGMIVEYGNKNPGRGMTAKDLEKLLVDAHEIMLNDPYYLPRNTSAVFNDTGTSRVEVEPSPFSRPGSFVEGLGRKIEPSSRTKFRTRNLIPLDPHDLEFMAERYGRTEELNSAITFSKKSVARQKKMDVRGNYKVHRIAPDIALQKYIVSSARDAVMFADDPLANKSIIAALKDFSIGRTNVRYPAPTGEKKGAGAWRSIWAAGEGERPAGGFSLHDIVETQMKSLEDQMGADAYLPSSLRQHVLPAVFGYRPVEDGASRGMAMWLKGHTLSLANSDFFKAVEAHGGVAERFVRGMRRYGTSAPGSSTDLGGSVASMFYGSTIGLNLNTALTNLLQPLHNLHQLGFKNTVKAYAQTIEQMYKYGQERARLGRNASPEQIEAAMDATMSRKLAGGVDVKMREIADISSAWDAVEKPGFGAQLTSSRGGVFEAVMKPFQITEMVNRLATGNAVLNAAEEGWAMGGRQNIYDPFRAQQEARAAVEGMQFGSSPLNRPIMFYKGFLSNPAIRQFMQFPVRSAVNILTMPDIVGGSRTVLGQEITRKGWLGTKGIDTMRMLGVSAIAYEVGKNMLGADLSRGLAVGFVPDVDVDKDKELMVPVPPFADAMYSGVRSFMAGGDKEILSDVVPMIIPGGVSISRALGGMPKSETLQALGLQKRYAGWDQQDAEGNVPVFDNNGRMLGMYSGSDIVLRSLGTDMGRFQNQGEVTQFLLKNRDQMRDQRREWIASVLGNNISQAQKIKANYERQFGMPLTVTQQQMREATRVREESVAARTLKSMDKDLQQQYQDVLQGSVPQAMLNAQMPLEQGAMYVWSNLPKR